MKTLRDMLTILALAACFIWGYYTGRRSSQIVRSTTVRVDTVFFEKPQPIRTLAPAYASVRVPRVLFAPADTVRAAIPAGVEGPASAGASDPDSVTLTVEIERRQYEDSTYRAQVSGPRIGRLGPSLDWIETYARTTERTVIKRSRFAVTAGAGVGYTPRGVQPYVGVSAGVILWQW